ncbi:GNAT family N-acetyltransferase [Flavobacterium sp. IB48]|uniref:GNAT family N-acetyltransferase n=1 Tax=Flavobacterium sp. IB48 TaxID=2779375 RepID=UPI0018E75A92|nr:GNAT family N-acetyltransferase [Flavobacterium sp. IB48]MBJ2126454.1 GNAT family N-acetyltransferase [Flavobacterium sp. IB48]
MGNYKVLNQQVFTNQDFSIVPIRYEDRLLIMKWRNEQIYHLRQDKPLTVESQENYFNNIVSKLFEQEKPNQILFSFLRNEEFVGYGGLVHINWIDKNAEISFLMNTSLEKEFYSSFLLNFLSLIEKVAFSDLDLFKIYTYAFDVRPQLYPILEQSNFFKEAVLKNHCFYYGNFKDVIIHSKFNKL